MEINIGFVITFLVVIFSINVVGVVTGLYPESKATEGAIISGSTYNNINTNDTVGSLDTYSSTYSGTDSTTSNDKDFLTVGANFISDVFKFVGTFISILDKLLFGYKYIFISLMLPSGLVWLFTGIIAFIQVACLLYLASYASSIIRGTNII